MEITSSTMLKPVYAVRHPPLAGEKVSLTIFDRAAIDGFIPSVFAYPAPAPSNEALKEGLLRALAPYPHLAGRLAVDDQGRRFLHLNNEGVLVVEAIVPADLADVLGKCGMAKNVDDLYPTPPEENVGHAVLQIQLNRCKCDGLVIGNICHHQIADGHSMSVFYTTWASAMRDGKTFIAPTTSPFVDRAATAVPRRTPVPVFDHRCIEFKGGGQAGSMSYSYSIVPMAKIKNLTAHFTAEFVAELKARVGFRCSTFECVLAHVWKKITAARGLTPETYTKVRVAVNCRGRARPPVPMDFFGNMVLWAFPRLQVGELLSSSYGGVVRAIHDAVARVDHEYVQSFVDFGRAAEEHGGEEGLVATAPAAGTMFCPDLEVDSWLGFRFHQLDLGTGPPSAFLSPDLPVEGLVIFVPSHVGKGGVDVFMGVAEDHVAVFEQMLMRFRANL